MQRVTYRRYSIWNTFFVRLHNDLIKNLDSFLDRLPCRVYKTCERVRSCASYVNYLEVYAGERIYDADSEYKITPLYSLCKHCCRLVKLSLDGHWKLTLDCFNDKIRDKWDTWYRSEDTFHEKQNLSSKQMVSVC